MSNMPAGESPSRMSAAPREMTYALLESRLTRMQRLESSEAGIGAASAGSSTEGPSSPHTTSVVFSDEPCEGCGGRHSWSRVHTTPPQKP